MPGRHVWPPIARAVNPPFPPTQREPTMALSVIRLEIVHKRPSLQNRKTAAEPELRYCDEECQVNSFIAFQLTRWIRSKHQ